MNPRLSARIALTEALLAYKQKIDAIAGTALAGTDSIESASKISVLAGQLAAASHDFYERLSILQAINLGIDAQDGSPDAASNNPDDFAGWAKEIARDRTFGPIQSLQAAE